MSTGTERQACVMCEGSRGVGEVQVCVCVGCGGGGCEVEEEGVRRGAKGGCVSVCEGRVRW